MMPQIQRRVRMRPGSLGIPDMAAGVLVPVRACIRPGRRAGLVGMATCEVVDRLPCLHSALSCQRRWVRKASRA